MHALLDTIRERLPNTGNWEHIGDDGATHEGGDGRIVFTTDAYVVTPIFFPGGDIGKIAFCGTVNDLAVMGAEPVGLSLSLVIEEGFPKRDLFAVIDSIAKLSAETGIPIVTGDTKVVERGGVDRIIIHTSGIGKATHVLDEPIRPGDHLIVSGGLGEHGTALMATRYELETDIETDSKPLVEEIRAIAPHIRQARDITRGGLATIANEMREKSDLGLTLIEEHIPLRDEVRAITELLGIDAYSLASEGRFACVVAPESASQVVETLRTFNPLAADIGEFSEGDSVIVETLFGKRILGMPGGVLVPRIC